MTVTQILDPRAIRSREALLNAATVLLHQHHAASITATDVVREAQVSRPTLYQHFGDLTSLFIAATEARLRTLFTATLQPVDDDYEAGRASIIELLEQLRAESEFFFHATRGSSGFAVLQALALVLAERLESHSPVRAILDLEDTPPHLAEFLAHGTVGLVARWLDSDFTGENSVEAMTAQIVSLLAFQLDSAVPQGAQGAPTPSSTTAVTNPKKVA
ncbi:TetR/AcrR family transcriptional regulator [Galactobacter caseinivorans]|uniref:TetR/AcrR family transcriptional regulator n=1 Tax=Galactobacter caseinivorans TaxID=2676123 RepID=A0A496PHS8_9MICC|nr:TetR/AcrR family transcriptional regulator [Galactobacter caseinivorans]RKW70044.1 TetR/AcrR family transcriptional regulator [Galactobacter caseinivorans]